MLDRVFTIFNDSFTLLYCVFLLRLTMCPHSWWGALHSWGSYVRQHLLVLPIFNNNDLYPMQGKIITPCDRNRAKTVPKRAVTAIQYVEAFVRLAFSRYDEQCGNAVPRRYCVTLASMQSTYHLPRSSRCTSVIFQIRNPAFVCRQKISFACLYMEIKLKCSTLI